MIDYAAACQDAATRQGLDTLADALDTAGVEYVIEQTGGFCMALTVRGVPGVVVATYDADTNTTDPATFPGWLTGYYPGDEWTEGGEGFGHATSDLAAAVERMADFATPGAAECGICHEFKPAAAWQHDPDGDMALCAICAAS